MSFGFELLESKKVSSVYAVTPSIATDERGDIWTSFLKDDLEELLPKGCLLYTSPSPRDRTRSRMPSSA